MSIYKAGLILEGGGMKGIYTAGVLEFFLDKEIEFASCYGVSAGVCHLCSFLSKQKKRAYRVAVNYLDNKRYCGMFSLLTTGDLFGTDMCYDLIPNYLDPYDFETFGKYEVKAYAVVTNIRTGKAEYMQLKDMHEDILAVRASSSMPLVSRKVKIGEEYYLDGGLADSIPIARSIDDGNEKNVVIMTGFRRGSESALAAVKARYARYPKVYELMKTRDQQYNETLDFLEEMEKEGKAFIIRPKRKSAVGRVEKDKRKLDALYEEGYRDAEECYLELLEYLS